MTIKQIEKILNNHSVPFYTKDGKVYADSMLADTDVFENVVNVTNWSKTKLFQWLGY